MQNFQETPGGLAIPRISVRCAFCARTSAEHPFRVVRGQAVCLICVATRFSRYANAIAHDKRKYTADVKAREALKDTLEEQRVADIAIDSVQGSHTALDETPKADRTRFTI